MIRKLCRFNSKELNIGRKVEMEHTNNPRIAERIAKDHLCEFPNYYSKGLIPMEKKLKSLK